MTQMVIKTSPTNKTFICESTNIGIVAISSAFYGYIGHILALYLTTVPIQPLLSRNAITNGLQSNKNWQTMANMFTFIHRAKTPFPCCPIHLASP